MDQTMNPKLKKYKRLFFTVMFSSVLFFVFSFFVIIIVAKIMGPPLLLSRKQVSFTLMMTLLSDKVMKCKNVTMYLSMKSLLM